MREIFTIGIILLFIGASVTPSVLGKNHSHIDQISEELIQTNPTNEVDNLTIYIGNITVTWKWALYPIIAGVLGLCNKVDPRCLPDEVITINMSNPGTFNIRIIANITLSLEDNFKIYRGGSYELDLRINGENQGGRSKGWTEKYSGSYTKQLTLNVSRNISENTTLNIYTNLGAQPILGNNLPWLFKWCERTTTVHVKLL